MSSLASLWLPLDPPALAAVVAGCVAGRLFARAFLPGKLGEVLFAPLAFTPFYIGFFLVERSGLDSVWKEMGIGWLVGFLMTALFLSGPMRRPRTAESSEGS